MKLIDGFKIWLVLLGLVPPCLSLGQALGRPIFYNHPRVFERLGGQDITIRPSSIEKLSSNGTRSKVILTASPKACAKCDFGWKPGEGLSGLNGRVYALTTWVPDGCGPEQELIVVGGSFTIADDTLVNNIVAWNGSSWQSLCNGINGMVRTLTVYNGELIAGGFFTSAGDNIARWDGTSWKPLDSGMNSGVEALAVYNGELIAAGGFDTAGGVSANCIARWDGATWQPLSTGMSGIADRVDSLVVYNGELIAGGYFTTAGGVSANCIARWDGAIWQPLGTGMYGRPNSVCALVVYNGELIAGGYFRTAGEVSANYIARWDGSSWENLGDGTSYIVRALTVYNGKLIAAGQFTRAGSVHARRISSWDGFTWQNMDNGMNNTVRALTVYDGNLIAGGDFWSAGSAHANRIARWDGSDWHRWDSTIDYGINNYISDLTVYNGKLIAAGNFTTAGSVEANRIARWDGATWKPLGSGMNYRAETLAVYNGDLIAGGSFTTAGDVSANHIARWDATAWQPMGSGLSKRVDSLAVYKGELFAGVVPGPFEAPGWIGKWDGMSWNWVATLGDGTGGGSIIDFAIFNGMLIAGGFFDRIDYFHVVDNIAQWDGVSWEALSSGVNRSVHALTVYNGELIAGGSFTTAGIVDANYIARWDGTSWYPLGSGMNGSVNALAVYNGELIAAGSFTTAGNVDANRIARWDGSTWMPLDSGLNGKVEALEVCNGELITGGHFSTAGGGISAYWARWGVYECSPPIPAEVRIVPRTLNLSSEGKWITVVFWLDEEYDVADIDPNSVLLEGEIQAESILVYEQQQVVIVRFSRSEVQGILNAGQVELTISGELGDGTVFEGTDVIRVIDKGKKLNQPPNVTITKPQGGALFGASETIEIEANAWDVDGSVVKVEFFANGSKIGEDNDGADGWKSSWNNHPVGSYSLTAKATDNDGAATTSPAVGITVVETPLPGQASNPNPADGATRVSPYANFSWTAGPNAVLHDVYFGTTSPGTFRGNQTATTFDPGTMAGGATYYWRIDEVNAGGTTIGTVWSFTTGGIR